MKARSLFALTLLAAVALFMTLPASAQLASPNSTGVTMGHVHLYVKDVDTQTKFFSSLGGVPTSNGSLQLIQFPGVYIALRKGDATEGTEGSVVNHFGFHVKSVPETLARIKSYGYSFKQTNPQQAFVTDADGILIELLEDSTISSPIEMHHVHMFVTDPLAVQAWYVKNFGAKAGTRGKFDTASLPGVEISLTKVDAALPATKGRSLDHIGFEIKNLDAFLKNLQAQGTKIDIAMRKGGNGTTNVSYITDPWGTYIELTQGLPPALTASK